MRWLYLWAGPKMAGTCLQDALLTGECRLSRWLGTTVSTGPSKPQKKSKCEDPPAHHSSNTKVLSQALETGTQPHGPPVVLGLDTPWSRDQQDQNMTNQTKCTSNTKGI